MHLQIPCAELDVERDKPKEAISESGDVEQPVPLKISTLSELFLPLSLLTTERRLLLDTSPLALGSRNS